MTDKTIAIIGAGVAGLVAGCYARMNGYRTTILEMYKKPGGLCTSWGRKPYRVDACIHWLCGSHPKSRMRAMWDEVGALAGRTIVDHEVFTQVEAGGKRLTVYTDLDRYETHLLELSPSDAPLVREYIGACRRLAFLDMIPEGTGFWRRITGIPAAILTLLRYLRMPQERFAARFKDPFLREWFLNGFKGLPDCPMLALVYTHALLHNRNAGYPVGGSLEFARAIEKRFLDLGGEMRYNARVVKVLVEDRRAVGVRLEDGSERRFDRVVSAADGHTTLFGMLGEEWVDPFFRRMYAEWEPFPPLMYLSFGVARDLHAEPQSIEMECDPFTVAGREVRGFHLRHFCFDPTLAPEGRSLVIVMFQTAFEPWDALKARDPEGYKAEKEKVAAEVLSRLEKRFPGITAQVEMKDVASPTTFVRYTGNWRGSFEGWLPKTSNLTVRVPATLKRLRGFYMIGQWVRPGGGLPSGLMSGREIVRRFCREDGLRFRAVKP
jgi:phytoene dehydrogenase-like protein